MLEWKYNSCAVRLNYLCQYYNIINGGRIIYNELFESISRKENYNTHLNLKCKFEQLNNCIKTKILILIYKMRYTT